MIFDFLKREKRSSSSYTDAAVQAILSSASGGVVAAPTGVGALEVASGVIGRALSSATVSSDSSEIESALNPEVLNTIGRELIRKGECLFEIRVMDGGLKVVLIPASTWTVHGDPDPDSWEYEVTASGPDGTETTQRIPTAGVIHCRYAIDPARPWRGLGPLQVATLTGRFGAGIEGQLGNESHGAHGCLVGLPKDGQSSTLDSLRDDLGKLKGRTSIVESGSWDRTGGSTAWQVHRLGFMAPNEAVQAHKEASKMILATCGVPVELFESSDGTGQREGWRRLLFGTVAPIARMVEIELSRKLDTTVGFVFDELRASDLSGRARAYKTLVEGKMAPIQAERICGFSSE